MPKDWEQPPSIFIPKKRKKYVCKFCGRDDFNSRQSLSMHRLHYCDKRPEAHVAADPPGPHEELARRLSTMVIPVDPSPKETVVAPEIQSDPTGSFPPLTLAPAEDSEAIEPADQEGPESDEPGWLHSTLFFFFLLLAGVVVLIIIFWNVIEREGKNLLKHYDPPAQGITGDGGRQPLTE